MSLDARTTAECPLCEKIIWLGMTEHCMMPDGGAYGQPVHRACCAEHGEWACDHHEREAKAAPMSDVVTSSAGFDPSPKCPWCESGMALVVASVMEEREHEYLCVNDDCTHAFEEEMTRSRAESIADDRAARAAEPDYNAPTMAEQHAKAWQEKQESRR